MTALSSRTLLTLTLLLTNTSCAFLKISSSLLITTADLLALKATLTIKPQDVQTASGFKKAQHILKQRLKDNSYNGMIIKTEKRITDN